MTAVKGSLLVTTEGMEIVGIPADSRDQAIGDFHRMKVEAERQHDCFYALPELYIHNFSYGDLYTGLLYRAWSDFHADPVLKCISQNTYQLIQSFSQCIKLSSIDSEEDFRQKEFPQANTGYCNPKGYDGFVKNISDWETWHQVWYIAHPQEIDWSGAQNDWLPRQDLILNILRREMREKLVEDGSKPEDAKQVVNAIADANVVHEFHDKVMKHKGGNLEGYASKIGGEICRSNYYRFEQELSNMEQQNAGSLRQIYSIVNKNGRNQFISIDFGHGMFEFHNEKGEHLGEYRFDGSLNSCAEVNHGLMCLVQWRKRTGK